jgi:putative membrane protein
MAIVADTLFAYLHFTAIFLTFAFLTCEAMLLRQEIDARLARLLARCDLWFFGSSMAALLTGLMRLFWGAKGAAFYGGNPVFWIKIALFLAIGLLSIRPSLAFVDWSRAAKVDPKFRVEDFAQRRARRLVMIEIHLLAFIPLAAVLMARGIGH